MAIKNSASSVLVTLFLFALVFSPVLQSEAARFTQRELLQGPICPACVCCEPPPPGECCPCCSTPVETSSETGTP
ncbi:hypothetical protein Acr_16g0008450 [Actinidia rufa]|uniref:Transmembrane protein n=1 Tax=Actinidia rufa TaxID=165716 RepID=A0A7J0FZU3_9ERIC|nr:hypothetical protein Acr_16g0008450 [Actinidia rufa]